jgi:maleate isomerase
MWVVDSSVEVLERMNEDVEACARQLGSAAVDVIAYACTGGSLLGGVGFDKSLTRRISEIAGGIPTVATATAVADGLRTLGVKKVSVVTPYPDDITEKVRIFLEESGFEVVSADGRRHKLNLDIGADTPEIIADFVDKHLAPEADGIFLSCTNWRAVEVAERLETETGLPVVTSNQATIWATLRTLGLDEPRPGYGRLFRSVGSTMAA